MIRPIEAAAPTEIREERRATYLDVAEWLSRTPLSETLWSDIQKADVTFELAMDIAHDACRHEPLRDRLSDYWRSHEALRAYVLALEEVMVRAWRSSDEPLPAHHARTVAQGLRLAVFLGTPAGQEFQDWFDGQADGPATNEGDGPWAAAS